MSFLLSTISTLLLRSKRNGSLVGSIGILQWHSIMWFALASLSLSSSSIGASTSSTTMRVLQVQLVHRHGDRSPITPMKDTDFWAKTLVPRHVLDKISTHTRVIHHAKERNSHSARGRGPFGQLTQLGLFQMIELGERIRKDLIQPKDPLLGQADVYIPLFARADLLTPDRIQVISTDFPRTIQSVQGTLLGLFSDSSELSIPIDAQHTSIYIPDPQPRRTQEQVDLEKMLARRPHVVQRNMKFQPLAIKASRAVAPFLVDDDDARILPWAQLSEITKCLSVRERLPPEISTEMLHQISMQAAWSWFEIFRNERMAYLAMNTMAMKIISSMERRILSCTSSSTTEEKPLILYSAHDSTLIGLLCAFHLDEPSQWPEYASCLKMELIEVTTGEEEKGHAEHFVRFSLNGELLCSNWGNGIRKDMISLGQLRELMCTRGASPGKQNS